MQLNTELRELAFRCEPVSVIRQSAIANGMRSLVYDGKIKVLQGKTTPAEVSANHAGRGIDLIARARWTLPGLRS